MTDELVTLPARWYYDAEIYERERAAIFAREWQVVAHAAQLQSAGDAVGVQLAGWRVFVVRDPSGSLRAFHDVCPHRAGPVVGEGEHRVATLTCGYHGWTFAWDGSVLRARDAPEVDLDGLGLTPVRVAEWKGLVFVNLDQGAVDLDAWLGGLADAVAGFELEAMTHVATVTFDLAASWKVYGDNYMEGYHIPFVHPGLHKEIDSRNYQVHVHGEWAEHEAPARDGAVNLGRWLWRWPNLALNLYPGAMNVERYVPTGPRTTRLIYDYFFADASESAIDDVLCMSAQVTEEDRRICEAVQANLESGAYDTGVLVPRHEQGVAAFHQLVRAALADERPNGPRGASPPA